MKNPIKRNIPGKRVHRNAKQENIDFIIKHKNETCYPSQRAYTKHIEPVHVELADNINKLKDELYLTLIDLQTICYENKLKISSYTLSMFLNRKYGPAFPPYKDTAESFFRLKQFLDDLRRNKQKTQQQQKTTYN